MMMQNNPFHSNKYANFLENTDEVHIMKKIKWRRGEINYNQDRLINLFSKP